MLCFNLGFATGIFNESGSGMRPNYLKRVRRRLGVHVDPSIPAEIEVKPFVLRDDYEPLAWRRTAKRPELTMDRVIVWTRNDKVGIGKFQC